MALTYTPEKPEFGQACPEFSLPGMDGKTYSLKNFSNGNPLVVMFICNHCPYVKAIEDRLIELGKDLKAQNINVVAICSNTDTKYTEDSFENLRKRFFEKEYSFFYLHDESQNVAKKFGAVCTPDYFMYDGQLKLRFRGRLDDNWQEADKVTKRELYEAAIDLKNHRPLQQQTPSMGCSIKWKV
ncbi:MAG: thioredoxin family protein [Bdellovibrionota bacterium]